MLIELVVAAALAGEDKVRLKDAPGKDKVVGNCMICHSLDYIPMNAGFLDKKGWEAVVNKMIKVMGAPIKPEDVPALVEYLAANYGPVAERR
jgi:hypothetical protein